MKPFDLEAAKRGDPLYTLLNGKASFIGLKKDGSVVLEYDAWIESRQQNEVFMAPKKRTFWVNLLISGKAFHYDTEESANRMIGSSDQRIGGKAYPVEIEE